MGLFGI